MSVWSMSHRTSKVGLVGTVAPSGLGLAGRNDFSSADVLLWNSGRPLLSGEWMSPSSEVRIGERIRFYRQAKGQDAGCCRRFSRGHGRLSFADRARAQDADDCAAA